MKCSFFFIYATITICSTAIAFSQSVRTEQVIRLENANNHAGSFSLFASPSASSEVQAIFPGGTPAVGQILKVDSVIGNRVVLSWANEKSVKSLARAYYTGSDTVKNAEWSKIHFNNESFDLNGEYDPSSARRFEAKEAGYYQVYGRVEVDPPDYTTWISIGYITIGIYKNGALNSGGAMNPLNVVGTSNNFLRGGVALTVSDIVYLNVGDYVEIYMFYTAPPRHPRTLIGGENKTFFTVCRIN